MNLLLYKPNSKNTGCGFNFSIDQRGGKPTFYINAIQQFSWNTESKNGSFSGNKDNPDKKLGTKLNETELGEMLSSFSSRVPWSAFHDFNDNKTSFSLTPWDKTRKIKGKTGTTDHIVPAFGFTVTRNGSQTFRISLEPGEVELLKSYIQKYLNIFFESTTFDSKTKRENNTPAAAPSPATASSEDDVPF